MPVTVEGQAGTGAPFATDNATLGTGRVPFYKGAFGPDGTIFIVDDAAGRRMPVKAVLSDTSDAEVKTGDAASNSQRVSVIGGASVAELQIDNAPYVQGNSGGVPSHGLYKFGGIQLLVDGNAGAVRCSQERVLHVTSPPRENVIQGFQTLTTSTAEITILPSIADTYQDLAFIGVYTDNITAPATTSLKVLFRDATGGPVRYTIPLGEKAGSNVAFGGLRWKQTTFANNWTVALSAPSPSPSSVFVHVIAEARFRPL